MAESKEDQTPIATLGTEVIEAQDLRLNDVVSDHGLVVKIEDDDGEKKKVVSFGSTREGKPSVESEESFDSEDKVKRVVMHGST